MADHFYGKILIGGPIPWDKAERLLTLLKQEHDVPEDVSVATLDDSSLGLEIAIVGFLEIEEFDAPFGQFQKLEAFLVENRIAFDRESAAKFDFNAQMVQYRPGQFDDKPVVTLLDATRHAVVYNDDICEVYKHLLSIGDGSSMTGDDATQLIHGSCTMLEKILGPDVPELELFEIVEEDHLSNKKGRRSQPRKSRSSNRLS